MTTLDAFLLLAAALLVAGVVVAVLARGRTARVLGVPVVAERPKPRRLALALVALCGVGVLALDARPLPLAVVVLSGALLAVAPDQRARVLGRDGVQRGWRAQRFEEVESWRLTGDHLRVLVRGEWEAVPAPAADHAALREVLEARAPGRESRFAD